MINFIHRAWETKWKLIKRQNGLIFKYHKEGICPIKIPPPFRSFELITIWIGLWALLSHQETSNIQLFYEILVGFQKFIDCSQDSLCNSCLNFFSMRPRFHSSKWDDKRFHPLSLRLSYFFFRWCKAIQKLKSPTLFWLLFIKTWP